MACIFINRFFYPDISATSQILSDVAFDVAKTGQAVHVITSRFTYNDPQQCLPPEETVENVVIHRVASARFGRRSLIGRAISGLSFYFTSAIALARIARRGDTVVTKTDPPVLSVITGTVANLLGCRAINWLQDLYPELAIELGVPGAKGILGKFVHWLRNFSLRHADLNVVIGQDMAARLRDNGVPEKKIAVIPNWTDDEAIRPLGCENPLRSEWGLDGKFVVGYSGNIGRAHDCDTVLDAAERLRDRKDIVFLFIGGGAGLPLIECAARARGLNIVLKSYQPRDRLAYSLCVADIHWLSLKEGLDGLILPSKFYGIAAAGRPMIVIGSAEGEFAKLVESNHCGSHVRLGDSAAFADVVTAMAGNPDQYTTLGRNARRLIEDHFSKARALERWRAIVDLPK